jgi:hypothetical protein
MEALTDEAGDAATAAAGLDAVAARPLTPTAASTEVMQLSMPYELVKGVLQDNARSTLEAVRLQVSVLRDELALAQQRIADANAAAADAASAAAGTAPAAALAAADQARREAEARLWQATQAHEQKLQVLGLQIGPWPFAPACWRGSVGSLTFGSCAT